MSPLHRTRSGLFFLISLFLPVSLFAHDPGLSSAKLTLRSNTVTVSLAFSRNELEEVLGPNNGAPGVASNWLAQAIRISSASGSIAPSTLQVRPSPPDNTEATLIYPASSEGELRYGFDGISDMNFGHRHYVTVQSEGSQVTEDIFKAGYSEISIGRAAATPQPKVGSNFFWLGVTHIFTGYDHLLFLFALLVVFRTMADAAKVITSFTVAHSLTLFAGAAGWVSLPATVVEPLIAASVIFVGAENILRRNTEYRGRLWIAFAFGLIHGLGFATVLREMELGNRFMDIARPLFAFNLGVEAGQLLIASIALPLLWRLQRTPVWSPKWILASGVVVMISGTYWLIDRL